MIHRTSWKTPETGKLAINKAGQLDVSLLTVQKLTSSGASSKLFLRFNRQTKRQMDRINKCSAACKLSSVAFKVADIYVHSSNYVAALHSGCILWALQLRLNQRCLQNVPTSNAGATRPEVFFSFIFIHASHCDS